MTEMIPGYLAFGGNGGPVNPETFHPNNMSLKESHLEVGFHFTSPSAAKLYQENAGVKEGLSSGFDLVNVENVIFSKKVPFQLIDLGVIIKVPEGYHSFLMPRGSTFKNHKIIQTNSIGLIDESYCGDKDIWKFPALWLGHLMGPGNHDADFEYVIPAGTRICQFIVMPRFSFIPVPFVPKRDSRGSFGSTGK